MPPDEQPLGSNEPLEEKLGYTRVRDEAPEAEPVTVEQAANDLTARRKYGSTESGSIETTYVDKKTGEPIEGKIAMTAEKAAHDLSQERAAEKDTSDYFRAIDVALAVEDIRAEQGPQSRDAPIGGQEQPQEQQPQQQPQQEDDGLDPELRAALQHKTVRAALDQTFAETQQARAAALQATMEASEMVQATIFAGIPELANAPPGQAPGVLAAIAQMNPPRYAAIMAQINAGKPLLERAAAIRQQNAEQEQQHAQERAEQFQHWAKSEDDRFSAAYPEFADPEKAEPIRKGVVSYLTQTLGIDEKHLPTLWNQPWFRDAKAQRMVYDAYRFHKASESLAKAHRDHVPNVPQPMRPGSRSNNGGNPYRASDNSEQIAELRSVVKNSKGEKALRAAAKIMTLERAARAR